ncbi:MAG: penicillin amidase [Cyclobacteriaceae bacterium]|nr:MAG: penicillin amidase [Cyclobacteriaceae bacterium]
MKLLKRALLVLVILLLLAAAGIWIYGLSLRPQLSGELKLQGLKQEVEVWYDQYGIPHIYARNEDDAYFALGFVHAQDRLFQMELLRRAAAGRLAEILGPDLIETDKFFRTLGLARFAQQHAERFLSSDTAPFQRMVHAYQKGINAYLKNGKTPVEFLLLNIPKEEFRPADVYLAIGFMSFGFAEGFRADPVLEKIKTEWGHHYLADLAIQTPPDAVRIKSYSGATAPAPSGKLIASIANALNALPVALWQGSNAWVVAGSKSASGKPVLANDTHIGYAQPAVWYEAHIEYPGFGFYGHHLAGIPFGLLGNNRFCGFGLTMFENDDVDFFSEKVNPENPDEVWYIDHWEKLAARQETIKVKGGREVVFTVRSSRHGPIINGIVQHTDTTHAPIALAWQLLKGENLALQAAWQLNHAATFAQARQAASMFSAPGLNVMYADTAGNIAWWAAARLPIRPKHVVSKLFLDGASGNDEYLGYYPFEQNPQALNPPWQYVYSANNQPDTVSGVLYPGYYYPKNRASRIIELLESKEKFSATDMAAMQLDVTSAAHAELAQQITSLLQQSPGAGAQQLAGILKNWNGQHRANMAQPAVYYTLLSQIIYMAMADEIGSEALQSLGKTSVLKNSYQKLIQNEQSPWWDDVRTAATRESRQDIINRAATATLELLRKNLGSRPDEWQWGKIHTLTHRHALGAVKLLNTIFSVGPFTVDGGSEVINNLHFELDTLGIFEVDGGPALRKVTDFADIENGISISPTGQSGNRMSPHYADQAKMFATGRTRPMLMNREAVLQQSKNRLRLLPE